MPFLLMHCNPNYPHRPVVKSLDHQWVTMYKHNVKCYCGPFAATVCMNACSLARISLVC